MILDGGPTGYGIESTILDLSRPVPAVLRRGAISIETLRAHTPVEDHGAQAAPFGQPLRAQVVLVDKARLRDEVMGRRHDGERAGALDWHPAPDLAPPVEILPSDPTGYAAGLYAALHRLEAAACVSIVAAEVPGGSEWAGVRDRLLRVSASAPTS
jgi:L-threonylcarbamoyladenylate synthase